MKKVRKSAKDGGAFSEKLKTSVLAALFTSYRPNERKTLLTGKGGAAVSKATRTVSSGIEESVTSKAASSLAHLFLSLRLRVYGTFIASFGIYTAVFAIVKNFILSGDRRISDIVFGLVVALSSIPIINSDETLSSALLSSRIGGLVRRVTGIREETMRTDEARGRANHGFLFGLAAGALSFFTSPGNVAVATLAAIALWLILTSPEFGVILTAFMIPLVPPVWLTASLGATAVSFIIKLIRGKRFVTVEMLDVSVFGIFLVILFGMIAPVVESSATTAVNMALCVLVYFLAANLMHGKKWVTRASFALVEGVAIASAVIIFVKASHLLGLGDLSGAAGIFGTSLFGARIGETDPACFNMILCAVFPIALSHFIKPPAGHHRAFPVLAMALMLFPLVEYRSAFAAIALAAASVLVLLIYSPRFIWLPLGTAAAGAVVTAFFPKVAEKVAAFFGAGYEGFANIRGDAWSDAADVLSRSFIGGVGIGPEAYSAVSSAHIQGAASAGHSYNTYLQIWIETGVVGLILFLLFIWFIMTAAFRTFDSLSLAKKSPGLILAAPSGGVDAYASEFSVSARMACAGPFCSVVGLLIYGAGDYVFSDMRVLLIFFLASGLTAACVRSTREEIESLADPHEADGSV